MANMFLSPEERSWMLLFTEVSAHFHLAQIWLAACMPVRPNCVPFRMQSQLYFLNMLMICRSLWLWHTAGPKRPGSWRQTYKLLLFETFSTSHLSPQRCSDGARPEVIFHSLMCVSGGKQRWGFLFICKYIISHLVQVPIWVDQLHCFIEAQCHRTPAESSVPVYLIIWNPFIETGQIWCCLVHAGSNSHLTPQKAQKCKYFHLHMFSILFWLRLLCFVNWLLNYKYRTKSHVVTDFCFYVTL